MKGTEADREKLRERVKAALGDSTQKELEEVMSVSAGTLTRIFGGRRNVDANLLNSLAGALDVDVDSIVEGTSFSELLDPTDAEAEETVHDAPVADADAETVDDASDDDDEPLIEEDDEPTAATLPDVAAVVAAEAAQASAVVDVVETDFADPPDADPDETLPVPDPEPESDLADAELSVEPELEEEVDPSLDAETLSGDAPDLIAGIDPSRAIDVDEAPEPDTEEPSNDEPRPGFGGRVLKFFSSIFGG